MLGRAPRWREWRRKAEWSQKLFELRQDHQSARAELDRASQANPEEWEETRGGLNTT